MEADLAGAKGGISERFVPDQDAGRLIEVEHLARYRWAMPAAPDRAVLDAGCGTAYGTKLLAQAGAREVVGVDLVSTVLDAVRPTMPENVRLEQGDLRQLPLEDDAFELIVCFEVIEHFEDPFTVLDELVRVLAPQGLLLISSPNRGVYPANNPHHLHEFRPEELQAELSARLANVQLVRQHDYVVSAVLGDDAVARGGEALEGVTLHKLIAGEPGDEVYTIAMASDEALPELHQVATMTGPLELREWMSVFDVQTSAIRDKDNHIGQLQARIQERDRLGELLTDAEQRLAGIPDLQLRIADLEYELSQARAAADAAREQVHQLDERAMRSQRVLTDVMSSPSWQVTKPLRAAKRLLAR